MPSDRFVRTRTFTLVVASATVEAMVATIVLLRRADPDHAVLAFATLLCVAASLAFDYLVLVTLRVAPEPTGLEPLPSTLADPADVRATPPPLGADFYVDNLLDDLAG